MSATGLLSRTTHGNCTRFAVRMLYGVPNTKYDGVWLAVADTAADIALERDHQRQQERWARLQHTKSSGWYPRRRSDENHEGGAEAIKTQIELPSESARGSW